MGRMREPVRDDAKRGEETREPVAREVDASGILWREVRDARGTTGVIAQRNRPSTRRLHLSLKYRSASLSVVEGSETR